MHDREPRPPTRPVTLAAWCHTCHTTQSCAPAQQLPHNYACGVCGNAVHNPVLRLGATSREVADSAA